MFEGKFRQRIGIQILSDFIREYTLVYMYVLIAHMYLKLGASKVDAAHTGCGRAGCGRAN
jgi:hypothetical protein